jgi:type IV pilus assembly protein PilB
MSATSIEPSENNRGAEATPTVLRTRIGAMTYLAPKGALTAEETIAALVAATDDCLQMRETQVVVDLANVPSLNSESLEAILDGQDRLMRAGGWLKMANVNGTNHDIFNITGFSDHVSLIDETDAESTDTVVPSAALRGLRLGDQLLAKGLITQDRLDEAIRLQQKLGKRVGQILVDKGWVSEQDLLLALGRQLDVPFVRLRAGLYDTVVVNLLDKESATRMRVLPLFRVRDELSLATFDPQSIPINDEVEERTGCRVRPVLARREDILAAINEAYSGSDYVGEILDDVDDDFQVVENLVPDDYSVIDEMAEGSPVINLVNSVIQRAVRDGASDIHLEPSRAKSRVRFRIDGVLYEVTAPRAELHPAIVSRLKVMANLDIAERRMPQDGRIQVHTQGRAVDLRFSSLPGLFGEKVVLRVLDKNQSLLDVNKLGMAEGNLNLYKQLLGRSYGLILATGPTGSGKTTSLYAALNYLNSIEKNIVTIEDPVEYQVDIVNQNEVRENIGLGFAKVLKHVLRQDPDIIMVGEIRERETAEIAVQAALTGHLVLSTLHTNSAIGAITRMIDMGVEPYLLSSALIGVLGQRLVRTICPSCKTKFIAPADMVSRYGWEESGTVHLARGRGCPECYDSGYKGRIGIHEVLDADDGLQQMVMSNPGREELAEYIKQRKMRTLFDDGLERVRKGLTAIEEVSRVINL